MFSGFIRVLFHQDKIFPLLWDFLYFYFSSERSAIAAQVGFQTIVWP